MKFSKEEIKTKLKNWWTDISTDKEEEAPEAEATTDDFLAKKSKPVAKGVRKKSVWFVFGAVALISLFAVFYGVERNKKPKEESNVYKEVVETRKAIGNHLQNIPKDYTELGTGEEKTLIVPVPEKEVQIKPVDEVKRPELPKQPVRHEKTREEIEAEAAYEAEQEAYKSPVKFDIKFDEK